MTKTEIKQYAKDEILHGICIRNYAVSDDVNLSDDDKEAILKELSYQMSRLEKQYGYEPYSWCRY